MPNPLLEKEVEAFRELKSTRAIAVGDSFAGDKHLVEHFTQALERSYQERTSVPVQLHGFRVRNKTNPSHRGVVGGL